jgi:pimeloyl-ACP methyl ester carboxylesterase
MDEALYTVDGVRLRYLEWGKMGSEPIVLVHGLSSTADAWRRVGQVLEPEYHVTLLRTSKAMPPKIIPISRPYRPARG